MHHLARFAAALIPCWAGLVQAQTTATRIRGNILSVEGNVWSVTTREGPVVKVPLNDPQTVMTVKQVALSDVTPGKYVGAAAVPGLGTSLSPWKFWSSRRTALIECHL